MKRPMELINRIFPVVNGIFSGMGNFSVFHKLLREDKTTEQITSHFTGQYEVDPSSMELLLLLPVIVSK